MNTQSPEIIDVRQREDYDPETFKWQDPVFTHPDGYPAREGEWSGVDVDPQHIDKVLQHEDWPTAEQAKRITIGQTSVLTSNYGLSVYRAFQKEPLKDSMSIVMLDERVFMGGANLQDVMQEAAHIAMDEGKRDDAVPFLRGIIAAAYTGNFPVQYIGPYQEVFFRTGRHDMIRMFVENVCETTTKGPTEAWQRLKALGNAVKNLPVNDGYSHRDPNGFSSLDKQILLEDIGHKWIRCSMPIAEIDFLP